MKVKDDQYDRGGAADMEGKEKKSKKITVYNFVLH